MSRRHSNKVRAQKVRNTFTMDLWGDWDYCEPPRPVFGMWERLLKGEPLLPEAASKPAKEPT